jgi:hypothetical protein
MKPGFPVNNISDDPTKKPADLDRLFCWIVTYPEEKCGNFLDENGLYPTTGILSGCVAKRRHSFGLNAKKHMQWMLSDFHHQISALTLK